MAKYLLLKHYRGGPERMPNCRVPMEEWTPEEVSAHLAFMDHVADVLRERGEFVDAQALSPEGAFVRFDQDGKPPVTDGPFAETKEQVGGFYLLECENLDEALAWAKKLPVRPGNAVEVRPVMDFDGFDYYDPYEAKAAAS